MLVIYVCKHEVFERRPQLKNQHILKGYTACELLEELLSKLWSKRGLYRKRRSQHFCVNLTCDHFAVKMFAMGQPTRPTQPSIFPGLSVSSNPCNYIDYGCGDHKTAEQGCV